MKTKHPFFVIISIITILTGYCCLNNAIAQVSNVKNVDTISDIVKYKISAISVLTYKTDDSTLLNKKLESKEKTIYSKEGNMIESIEENSSGKIISKTEAKYDAKNNLIQSTSYDSLNKISDSYKNTYNSKNEISETTISQPLNYFTAKPADADKYYTYTEKYKYDNKGNHIESATDSSGIEILKTISTFNDKGQTMQITEYDHGKLYSNTAYTYDAKGNYTINHEYYLTSSKTECSPSKNKSVVKYNSKGDMLSSLDISEQNGMLSTTKTTYLIKYEKEKLISYKTITETYGEGFSSKNETSSSYKYDNHGNQIESTSQSSGYKSTVQLKYNTNNEITEQVTYNGSCTDKPSSRTTYAYYPDGKTLKTQTYISYESGSKDVTNYDERSLSIDDISTSTYGSYHRVYQYEYWK